MCFADTLCLTNYCNILCSILIHSLYSLTVERTEEYIRIIWSHAPILVDFFVRSDYTTKRTNERTNERMQGGQEDERPYYLKQKGLMPNIIVR